MSNATAMTTVDIKKPLVGVFPAEDELLVLEELADDVLEGVVEV